MDMNDPVMQAMMQQCMKDMHQDNRASEKDQAQADRQDKKEAQREC